MIFIGSYVGEGVSGSHRQERFIKKALDNEYEVVLIKPAGNWIGYYNFVSEEAFLDWKRKHPLMKPKGSVNNNKFIKYIVPLKYWLFIDVFGYGFFKTLLLLKRVLKENSGSQLYLMASSPSISAAFAAYIMLKFYRHISFTVDMRDAWALHPKITILRTVRKSIERMIVQSANHVLTVSRFLKEEFDNNYNISSKLLYNINTQASNVIEFKRADSFSNDCLNVSYFGSLPRGFYKLNEFCEGLINFLEDNSEFKILFHFYGSCSELQKVAEQYPLLSNYLIFNENVPHSTAIELMRASDAVLFFGFDGDKNSGVVSTKIFEYFSLGLKIIPFDIRVQSDLDWLFLNICDNTVNVSDPVDFGIYLKRVLSDISLLPYCKNYDILKSFESDYDKFLICMRKKK